MIMDDNDSKNNCSFTVAVMRCFHHGIAQETEHMKGKNTDLYCIPFELLQVINNLSRETSWHAMTFLSMSWFARNLNLCHILIVGIVHPWYPDLYLITVGTKKIHQVMRCWDLRRGNGAMAVGRKSRSYDCIKKWISYGWVYNMIFC